MSGTEKKQLGVKLSDFWLGALKRVGRRTTGIGDTNIEPAKAGFNRGNERSSSSGIRDIERLMENFAARGFAYVRSGLGKGRRSTSANGHVSAFAGEFFRDGAAQSFAGSRDDRDAPRDPQIHSGTSSKLVIVSQNGRDRQWRVR